MWSAQGGAWFFFSVYWPALHVWVLVYWPTLHKTVLWFM